MAIAVALWSAQANSAETSQIIPQSDLRITNIALGEELADESGRTTVKLIYRPPIARDSDDEDEDEDDDESDPSKDLSVTVLCSLTPGKIEQATVDIVLDQDEEYLIEIVGKNTVHLTGNYIDQMPPDQVPYNDEDEDDSDEEAYDLREVSSDVEYDPDEMEIPSEDEGRFEEVNSDAEEAPKQEASKKRPRESDAMETDAAEDKLSKSQKKKLKKLKAADGKAVETGAESTAVKANAEAKEGEKKEKKEKKDKKAEKAEKAEKTEQTAGEEKQLEGGVKIKDHKIGSGPKAKKGDMVSMRYLGKLQNGKVFDKNTGGAPFKFRLGSGEVIKGWDVGITGMQIGGERLLTVPPNMGYGKKKLDSIPANSTLIFEVKLLKIN